MVHFSYKPLPDYLEIRNSKVDGLGLFAIQSIPAGLNLGRTHFYFKNAWERTPLGGFINHSDNPNSVITTFINSVERELWTARPIKKGEEITIYYTLDQEDS